jgi:cystathionine beta-lyase
MSTFDNKPKALQLSTHLVHSSSIGPEGFNSLSTPVYRGSSIFFPNTAAQRAPVDVLGLDYSYGLHGNPTQYTLAKKLAEIEGAKHALVCASGLAAIALVVKACLKQGDHWLLPENAYGPVHLLAEDLLSLGIEYSEYDPCNLSSVANQLRSNTRLVWVEAPGSLTFEVPDLKGIVQLAQGQNIRTALDNTWSAGIAFKPFEHGFDYSVHALTKYQNGHADVLMGAVLSNDTDHFAAVEHKNRIYGMGVSPSDCELVLRGLLTLPLRYQHQGDKAYAIAQALQAFPAIARVLHPALPSCLGHTHFKALFQGQASVFAVVLQPQYTDAQACAIVDALKLFRIAYSWGGPESLALVVNVPNSRKRNLGQNGQPCGPILRLAIGLEDTNDLINDLEQAFQCIQ